MRRTLTMVALASLLASCDDPALTEILVVVDTDLTVPDQIRRVSFVVQGPNGDQQAALGDFEMARPVVVGLVYRGGPLGPLEISVAGERPTGETVRTRRARVSFLQDRAVMLRMDLTAACDSAVRCENDETCAAGACRPVEIAPDELEDWPGSAPPLDGGVMIGMDAGTDAGAMDAGFDAGVVMCGMGGVCDDMVPCTMDTCEGDTCAFAPDDTMCAADMVDCTVERCDRVQGCVQAPQDAMCDDAIPCTVDTCDPASGCSSTPSDAACDDGVACTMDVCDAATGCSSTPSDAACEDGIPCTADRCDAAGCSSTVDHALCASGQFCDAAFMRDCVAGPTFTDLYNDIITSECRPCHTQAPFEANLDFSSRASAYANLVGVTAECGGGSNTLVIARNATESLLWRKLSGVNLCGEMMPRRMTSLPATDITAFEQWINAGAPDN